MLELVLALVVHASGLQMIDGVGRPRETEANFRLACQDSVGRIGYRQEYLDPGDFPRLDMAFGVRLRQLSVSGRTIAPAERAKAEALFATFGWVTNTDARCFDGRFQFNVTAMPKQGWIDFIEERRSSRPETELHTIEISRDGEVTVDGRGM